MIERARFSCVSSTAFRSRLTRKSQPRRGRHRSGVDMQEAVSGPTLHCTQGAGNKQMPTCSQQESASTQPPLSGVNLQEAVSGPTMYCMHSRCKKYTTGTGIADTHSTSKRRRGRHRSGVHLPDSALHPSLRCRKQTNADLLAARVSLVAAATKPSSRQIPATASHWCLYRLN